MPGRHLLLQAAAIIILAARSSFGATACQEFFAGGEAPVVTNARLTLKYRDLCNTGYAVGHSGLTRTPIWSAEYLTREHLAQGRGLPRVNNFRPDLRLPRGDRKLSEKGGKKKRRSVRDYWPSVPGPTVTDPEG